MLVCFATLCDLCAARSPEYTSWPTCRECGRDTCLACARLHTLHDNDGRQTVVCVDCGPSIDGDHDGGKYLAEVAHELAEEIIRRIEVEHPDVQVSEN